MKSIILYESKTGCTEKCAQYINENNNSELSRLSKYKGTINDYETIVLMSPVYMGKINKKISKFMTENKHMLLKKKVIIILCCMNVEGFEEMIKLNFEEDLRNHAQIIRAGGAYYFEKLNFLYKRIIKAMAKIEETTEEIEYETLDKIKI